MLRVVDSDLTLGVVAATVADAVADAKPVAAVRDECIEMGTLHGFAGLVFAAMLPAVVLLAIVAVAGRVAFVAGGWLMMFAELAWCVHDC